MSSLKAQEAIRGGLGMMSVCEEGAFMVSSHAATRMAQRGIRRASLDLVLLHGTRAKAQRECEEFVLLGRTARQLEAAGYDRSTIAVATKVRAIVDADGRIVTCYYQRRGRSRPSSRTSYLRDFRYA
jgi:hypothetical protein